MRTRLRRLQLRDLALFVVLAGVVTLTAVCGDHGSGLDGDQAGASTELSGAEQARPQPNEEQEQATEQLTLRLSGPEICETDDGIGGVSSQDAGNGQRRSVYLGIVGVEEVPVRWQIQGGTPPYQLEIDGETQDALHVYEGASGTAAVSCALRLGEVTYVERTARSFRRYKGDVLVDSGLKRVRGVVTDRAGQTSTTELSMYVIEVLEGTGIPLTEGQTYRVWGQLLTAPAGVATRIGGIEVGECGDDDVCEASFDIYATGNGYLIGVGIGVETGTVYTQGVALNDDDAVGAGDLRRQAEDHLAALIDSIGQPPLQGVRE